jgi:hypothetical protein
MKISQQIVSVNQRLGNTAVPNMQGTTRYIFDSQAQVASNNQTLTFFQNVSQRAYPSSNINNNRFEVGESLAITGISYFWTVNPLTVLTESIQPQPDNAADRFTNTLTLDLFIGNQRVIKNLDLNYSKVGIGEAYDPAGITNVIRLETPIVIPPQIEFYATVRITGSGVVEAKRMYLGLFGQGTLLNTKSTF